MTTQAEALEVVRVMRFAAQKFRSGVTEDVGDDEVTERVVSDLYPWMFGELCILPTLMKIEETGQVEPSDWMNLLYIWNRPEMAQVYTLYVTVFNGPELPEGGARAFVELERIGQ